MIMLALGMSCVLGLGVLQLEMETSSTELWIPRDSPEYINRKRTSEIFQESGSATSIFAVTEEPDGDILDEQHGIALLQVLIRTH